MASLVLEASLSLPNDAAVWHAAWGGRDGKIAVDAEDEDMPDPSESDGRTGSRTRAHGQAHHGRTLAVCAADKTTPSTKASILQRPLRVPPSPVQASAQASPLAPAPSLVPALASPAQAPPPEPLLPLRLPRGACQGGHWRCFAVLEEGHQRTIRWCSWSPCGLQLASCSFDGLAMIWRCETDEFECVASLEGHENEVKAVAWSASGSFIATCGRDKSVFVWE
eukprot:6208061-Pleurochrysis_carterae.AAC.1